MFQGSVGIFLGIIFLSPPSGEMLCWKYIVFPGRFMELIGFYIMGI